MVRLQFQRWWIDAEEVLFIVAFAIDGTESEKGFGVSFVKGNRVFILRDGVVNIAFLFKENAGLVVRRDVIWRYPCRFQKSGECCVGLIEREIRLRGEEMCFGVIWFQRDDVLQCIHGLPMRSLFAVNMNHFEKHVGTRCV